ncbi:YgjV family protein [bacterium]|nr:YgjV family protein [bacterium]
MSVICVQIIGILSTALLPIIYACKTKPAFYGMHMVLSLLRMFQYLLLGAWTGAISGGCSIIKNFVYFVFSMKGRVAPVWTMLFFVTISFLLSLLGFTDILSVLPLLIIIVTGYGNWQHNYIVMCVCNIVAIVFGFTYSFAVGAYGSLLAYSVEFIVAIIGIIRTKINTKGD